MARSFFHRLFGGSREQEYLTGDIRSVSISCGHMSYSHSYSFYLRKEESGWLLDADFAPDEEKPHTEFELRPVTDEDADALLDMIRDKDILSKLKRYKKPKLKAFALDETAYCTSILFKDGKRLTASAHISSELELSFYHLAAKYADTVTEE